MKKIPFTIPFKSNFFKEQDPFHLVLVFFIIFFGTAVFFSIPTFYDYKKYNQQIENAINDDLKINMTNLQDISFKFIPSPHLLIKKSDLKIKDNENDVLSELQNVKVFISITDLYKNDKFKIKKIVIDKANFYLNKNSLKNLILNLKTRIINDLEINKSNLFFRNENKEIILISKIKKLSYKIDLINKKKILKLNGNIFDSDYDFKYLIDYEMPNIQNTFIDFNNPNLSVENKLITFKKSEKNHQKGNIEIKFLNKKNIVNYEIINKKIFFKNNIANNSLFNLNGSINFDPFHFDLKIDLKKINLIQLEKLLFKIYKNNQLKYENLSGVVKINFENIHHKIMNKGLLEMVFENSTLSLREKKFNLSDFAILEIGDYEYTKDSDENLQIKIKINILKREKFNRFLFNYKKNKIMEKNIYFTYRYDARNKNNFISQISSKGYLNNSEFYQFKNLQQLKILLKDENLFNLD
tara:strand:+ start:59 stop:1462 length:1404 start_codon:yes stop_codon:yes gene_type:complete